MKTCLMLVWELNEASYSYVCLLMKFHFPLINVKTLDIQFILIFYIILLSNYYLNLFFPVYFSKRISIFFFSRKNSSKTYTLLYLKCK